MWWWIMISDGNMFVMWSGHVSNMHFEYTTKHDSCDNKTLIMLTTKVAAHDKGQHLHGFIPYYYVYSYHYRTGIGTCPCAVGMPASSRMMSMGLYHVHVHIHHVLSTCSILWLVVLFCRRIQYTMQITEICILLRQTCTIECKWQKCTSILLSSFSKC